MRKLIFLFLAALLCASCSRQVVYRDDDTGKVVRVFRAVAFSASSPRNRAFRELLTFVRVENTGDVVMKLRGPQGRDIEIRAQRGALFSDRVGGVGESASKEIGLRVRDCSYAEQSATIEYEAWSADARQ
jgi:hypothetical protein